MNVSPADKIQMYRQSIRCFIFGLLGLLPIIGLPFALAAAVTSSRVKRTEKLIWNVARPYRLYGLTCAIITGLIWLSVSVILLLHYYLTP